MKYRLASALCYLKIMIVQLNCRKPAKPSTHFHDVTIGMLRGTLRILALDYLAN